MFRNKQNSKINTNSSKTMTFTTSAEKKPPRNSRLRTSMMNTKASLLSKSMYLGVVLPDKPIYFVEDKIEDEEEISEWMAENTVEFHGEVQSLYQTLASDNPEWTTICEESVRQQNKGYPKNVKYMWKAARDLEPMELPVDGYVNHVLLWTTSQIENEEIFPSDEDFPFPNNFKKHLKKMFQRMFRVFAIIYSNDCLKNKTVSGIDLDVCFRHFMYFAFKWELIDAREWKCIDKVVQPIKEKYVRDEQAYLNHTLPYEGE